MLVLLGWIWETADLLAAFSRSDRLAIFDKLARRNDATGSNAKRNAFCLHLWRVRARRPLYRRGTSVTRALVEPGWLRAMFNTFPVGVLSVSDAFV